MHNYNYKINPEHDIRHGTKLILYGLSHKETDRPAWAIPGGTFTTCEQEAARVAELICKMGRGEK